MRSIVAAADRSLYRPSADHERTVVEEWDPDRLARPDSTVPSRHGDDWAPSVKEGL
jgi:hypothetical protein